MHFHDWIDFVIAGIGLAAAWMFGYGYGQKTLRETLRRNKIIDIPERNQSDWEKY